MLEEEEDVLQSADVLKSAESYAKEKSEEDAEETLYLDAEELAVVDASEEEENAELHANV